jgi:hypothetical protein
MENIFINAGDITPTSALLFVLSFFTASTEKLLPLYTNLGI